MRRALSSARLGLGAGLRLRSTLAPAASAIGSANGRPSANTRTNTRASTPPRPQKPPFVRRQREPADAKRLRVLDGRVGALLAHRTTTPAFVALCEQLRGESQAKLLANTDTVAWKVALQKRLKQDDVVGARALLDLLLGAEPEHASERLWRELLFAVLSQRALLSSEREVTALLSTLCDSFGSDFVARVLVSLVNGCAKLHMFDEARLLVRFHRSLSTAVAMPPSVLGNLVSTMQASPRAQGVFDFTDELLEGIPLAAMPPQVWIALVCNGERSQADLSRRVHQIIDWFHAVKDEPADADRPWQLEPVLGAVVQRCVASGNERLALRVFDAMTREDEEDIAQTQRRARPDENIYVNVLKACRVLLDKSLFRDVYRRMVRDGVARSAGFGSAIRFCHAYHDVEFLDQVLEDAFEVEETQFAPGSKKRWFLEIEQYNDALGCFAETKKFERANDLFARLLAHPSPRVAPDRVTMVEMVENYMDAPFADVMHLMESFLDMDVKPDMYVFTSLLAACGRHRLMNDALALREAMASQRVAMDIKTFTALGFVYAVHSHVAGIVELLKDMETQGVKTDAVFFNVVLDGLYAAEGIDLCFALFRETLDKGLSIPAGMYASLIAKGTTLGLVERTLHIAYNMECDGFMLTSEQLLGLMHRCESSAEVAALVRTFLLLHQGRTSREPDADGIPHARFSQDVYEEMVDLLTASAQGDAVAKVRQLAEAAGYFLP
jgi:hypothetical protein